MMRVRWRTLVGALGILAAGCAQAVTSPTSATDSSSSVQASGKPGSGPVTLSLKAGHWTFYTGGGYATSLKTVDGALTVPFPVHPATVGVLNYLFTQSGPSRLTTAQTVEASWTITTTGLPVFHWDDGQPANCNMPPMATLFFWSNRLGEGEFDRWWAYADTATLGGGSFSRAVPLDPTRWFSVYGVHGDAAPTAFATALANVSAFGVTFGGGCYYGHGVYTTGGAAAFALTRYEIR